MNLCLFANVSLWSSSFLFSIEGAPLPCSLLPLPVKLRSNIIQWLSWQVFRTSNGYGPPWQIRESVFRNNILGIWVTYTRRRLQSSGFAVKRWTLRDVYRQVYLQDIYVLRLRTVRYKTVHVYMPACIGAEEKSTPLWIHLSATLINCLLVRRFRCLALELNPMKIDNHNVES